MLDSPYRDRKYPILCSGTLEKTLIEKGEIYLSQENPVGIWKVTSLGLDRALREKEIGGRVTLCMMR